jgi:hypothetical protein
MAGFADQPTARRAIDWRATDPDARLWPRRENPAGNDALRAIRRLFYECLYRRADILFEVADAILTADGAAPSPAHLSLQASHRRDMRFFSGSIPARGVGRRRRDGRRGNRRSPRATTFPHNRAGLRDLKRPKRSGSPSAVGLRRASAASG